MFRTAVVTSLVVAALTPAPVTSQAQPAARSLPSASIDLYLDAGSTGAVGGRVAYRGWGIAARWFDHRESDGGVSLGPRGAARPFEETRETSIVVERGIRWGERHALTIAGGLGRWSGRVADGPARHLCGSSFFGEYCTTSYEVETFDPSWGFAAEAFYHLVLTERWRMAPSRIMAGAKLSPRSSLSGLYIGIGFGGIGR